MQQLTISAHSSIEIVGAEQSSTKVRKDEDETYVYHSAQNAIDADPLTSSQTDCECDKDIWFRTKFTGLRCLKSIQMRPLWHSESNSSELNRLAGTEVRLKNMLTKEEHLCGTVASVGDDDTLLKQLQYHHIDCSQKCGHMIELKVRRSCGKNANEGCIQLKEIEGLMDCAMNYYRDGTGTCVPCTRRTFNNGASECSSCPESLHGGTDCTTSVLEGKDDLKANGKQYYLYASSSIYSLFVSKFQTNFVQCQIKQYIKIKHNFQVKHRSRLSLAHRILKNQQKKSKRPLMPWKILHLREIVDRT